MWRLYVRCTFVAYGVSYRIDFAASSAVLVGLAMFEVQALPRTLRKSIKFWPTVLINGAAVHSPKAVEISTLTLQKKLAKHYYHYHHVQTSEGSVVHKDGRIEPRSRRE